MKIAAHSHSSSSARAFLVLAFSALPLTFVSYAQESHPPMGEEQTPAPETPPLAGIPAAPQGPQMLDQLKLSDNPLSSVLYVLEQLTGRAIIRPQALPTPTFTFNSQGPISKQDAILAIESLLSINGIGVAPLGDKFIKVVPVGNIRTEAPELIIGTLKDQPPSGKVISKLFRLEHLDTTTFQTQVQPFLSPNFGTVVPFQNSNTLLVTDTISNLQRLEYVLSEVDKPRNLVTKFYTLQFAQAQAVAEKIRTLVETTRTAFTKQQAASGGPVATPGGEGGNPTTGVSAAFFASSTSINFDERTNQIIIVAEPSGVSFYENLIRKLDVQADPSTQIAVIQIQHASASEVASLLAQFISGSSSGGSSRSTTGSGSRREGSQRQTFGSERRTRSGSGGGSDATPAITPPPAALPSGGGSSSSGERNSQFSDFMTIVSDERSNAIVASGTQDDLTLIRDLIKKIDVVLPQVRIEVLIAEVTLSNSVARGIDSFNLTIDNDKVVGFSGSGPGFGITDGIITRATGLPLDYDLKAAIKTNNSKSNVNILSAPTIVTTHNKEASILVGEARPIITSTQSELSGSNGSTGLRSSFTFQDIGLELTVKPLIGEDGTIQLEIEQSADSIVSTVTIDGNAQPVIGRRQASSFVSVGDGEIIVLGGLQSKTRTKGSSSFPIVGELPLLGSIFGSSNREDLKTELLLFIRPVILRTPIAASADAKDSLQKSSLRREDKRAILKLEPEPEQPQDNRRRATP